MSSSKIKEYDDIVASPVKSFFVSMLTRDIALSDAILDLLDNCVDGIHRRKKGKLTGEKPYKNYWAEIEFGKDSFLIRDNCGGIPWSEHGYAWRMGRADSDRDKGLKTVGTYGIGMKRAIFKIGEHCLINTRNENDTYEVDISPDWMKDESAWNIPVKTSKKPLEVEGTEILIMTLREGIAEQFDAQKESFQMEFEKKVASHYAFIIDKGFQVKVNGKVVEPRPTKLAFSNEKGASIKPFIYRAQLDGVEIFLAVGFTRPIPSQDSVLEEQNEKQYSSIDAGWTVVCNERAVVYCDKTELTGWGEANVPAFHNQFIAISGIVEFTSDQAAKLPTNTTKRGIDASSPLFLKVKNKMREGMAIFTDYTNKWKGRSEEAKSHVTSAPSLTLSELKDKSENLTMSKVGAKALDGQQFKPHLPLPKAAEPDEHTITFKRKTTEISVVSKYLLKKDDAKPSKVGEACFDAIFKEAQQ